jgi:hypothetical protein
LQSLDLSACDNISDSSMIEISKNCTHLRLLDISGSDKITDTSMIEIGKNCTQLQSLNISDCEKITDTTKKTFRLKKDFNMID